MKKNRILARERFYADNVPAETNYLLGSIMKIESELASLLNGPGQNTVKENNLLRMIKEYKKDLEVLKDENPEYFV